MWIPVLTQHSSGEVWTLKGSLGGKKKPQKKMFRGISKCEDSFTTLNRCVITVIHRARLHCACDRKRPDPLPFKSCACVQQLRLCSVTLPQPELSRKLVQLLFLPASRAQCSSVKTFIHFQNKKTILRRRDPHFQNMCMYGKNECTINK